MVNGDQHPDELIEFHALGALDAVEKEIFEKHLAHCERCRALLDEAQVGARTLPYAATPILPSPRVKQALFERVRADARSLRRLQAPQRVPTYTWRSALNILRAATPGLAIILVLLLVAIGWWISNLNDEIEQLRAQNQNLNAQLEQQRVILALVNAPGVVPHPLQGTQIQPNARGQLYADPSAARAVLFVSKLKPLPPGRVYQVWLIKDKTPVGVGTLTVDAQGNGQTLLDAQAAIGSYQIAALTEEPEGGSSSPTTDVLMAGQF